MYQFRKNINTSHNYSSVNTLHHSVKGMTKGQAYTIHQIMGYVSKTNSAPALKVLEYMDNRIVDLNHHVNRPKDLTQLQQLQEKKNKYDETLKKDVDIKKQQEEQLKQEKEKQRIINEYKEQNVSQSSNDKVQA